MVEQAVSAAVTSARNALRIFYNAAVTAKVRPHSRSKNRPYWQQLQKIRQETQSPEFAAICNFVEDNPAYPFPGFGNGFPTDENDLPNSNFRRMKPLGLAREALFQVARLTKYAPKLAAALSSLSEINEFIISNEFAQAERAIQTHKSEFGLSLVILKKEFLVSLQLHGFAGLSKLFKTRTDGFQGTAWAVLCKYVFDFVDPTDSPERAVLAWLKSAEGVGEGGDWFARPLLDDLLTFSKSHDDLAADLLRASSISALDGALSLWRKKCAHPSVQPIQSAFDKLPTALKNVLVNKFQGSLLGVPQPYKAGEERPGDDQLYRLSFIFDDLANVIEWKCQFNSMLFANRIHLPVPDTAFAPGIIGKTIGRIAENPSVSANAIEELASWQRSIARPDEVFSTKFLESAAIAGALRLTAHQDCLDPVVVCDVIAKEDEVLLYLSSEDTSLLGGTKMARSYAPLAFIVKEMSYRKSRLQDDELERRLSFMELFAPHYDRPVVDVIAEISKESLSTASLIAKACTRSFLERLFFMMSSVKQVIETRIAIAEWLIANEIEETESFEEELAALKRELQNLGERSDLDSTRVHVDEEGLWEWFAVNQAGNVNRYIQTVLMEGPSTNFVSMLPLVMPKHKFGDEGEGAVNFDTNIGSEHLLLAIAETTLRSFSEDKVFGLDAYLSRRIRHGTLSGHITTPITRIFERLVEARDAHKGMHDSSELGGIDKFASEFRKYLSAELDHVRKDVIQIKSHAHPAGIINADWRIAANIAHLDAMIVRVRKKVIETGTNTNIFPDIYAFCWDCLETDLAALRRFFLRKFYPNASAKLAALFEVMSPEEQGVAFSFSRMVVNTLGARTSEVCGWFSRPVFRRDIYSLQGLISSTFSLARELDASYAFEERVDLDSDIALNRASFETFGDVLFVLLGNAARYGKEGGAVSVSARPVSGQTNLVELSITSEIRGDTDLATVESRIKAAVHVVEYQSISDAAVEEGFSGLRKLLGIITRVRTPDVEFKVLYNVAANSVTFNVLLPPQIGNSLQRPH